MGALSPMHWVVVAIVLVLLFGNRLPGIMRSLGKGVVEFKKGVQGIEDDVKTPVNRIEGPPSQVEAKEEGKASDGEPILR